MSDTPLDPRVNAFRVDLAAVSLRGRVNAANYSEGWPAQLIAASAPLRREPRFDAVLDTELLFGETVRVYDDNEGWAWVQADYDSYVGYLPADALSGDIGTATHRVAALRTHIYPAADIKAPPLDLISMNARVAVESFDDQFAQLEGRRFLVMAHLAETDSKAEDFVSVAEAFLGTPYLWGGRTSIGLDCSALVQLALQAAGMSAPRDTDMQERAIGSPVPDDSDPTAHQRGDLVFWEGHVGIMQDETRLLHANAHHMAVASEPVADAIARIEAAGKRITSVRRLA